MTNVANNRRHDLDWIRVLAVIALLFFHTGMLFTAEWGWHIKNAETSNLFLEWMYFMSGWRMSLLFFVSGAGTAYALRKRSAGQYSSERGKRLLIPLLFGILFVIPPQIYFERLFNGQIEPGYLTFWLSSLGSAPYPAGNTSWHHLWFVLYLFLYSVLALPLFLALRRNPCPMWLRQPRLFLVLAGAVYALVYAGLTIPFPGPQNLIDDWGRFVSYFILFVLGFVTIVNPEVGQSMVAGRRLALQLAVASTVALNVIRWNGASPAWTFDLANFSFMTLRGVNGFCWMVCLLGYARTLLNKPARWLGYANEAVYPFYILHQTVIVVIGYYVVHTSDDILTKFIAVSVLSFALSMALYELFIRRTPWLRPFFGLKPLRRTDLPDKKITTDAQTV